MNINLMKMNILLVSLILISFSCTKEKRKEVIKNEVVKEDSIIKIADVDIETSKYLINTRTGKVHSFTHGKNIVSERYQLESNDDIENILENENYDICLTCYAGLDLNLDRYKTNDRNISNDEIDITNREVNLIRQYMKMYEFGKIDTETQKFLVCIFEVGSWYVENVYTQLGGQKTAQEVDDIAEVEASKGAYNKWRNYLDIYGRTYEFKTEKKILPTIYDENNNPTDMALYKCDLFKNAGYGKENSIYSKTGMVTLKNAENEEIDKEWKNYCVVDDSSKFAAAVYYHYINKEILKDAKEEDRIAYGIDLWETKSIDFSKLDSFTKKLLKTKKFKIMVWDDINDEMNVNESHFNENKLKTGDLLYRKGNVEFYLGNNKVVGWGRVHKEYFLYKELYFDKQEIYSNDAKHKNMSYEAIIRFEVKNYDKE